MGVLLYSPRTVPPSPWKSLSISPILTLTISPSQWKVVQVSDNSEYVKIVNCWNHKVLSIQNQSLDRGALTIQEDDSGLPSQQWLMTSDLGTSS